MKHGDFTGIRGIPNQDIAMWETMGPIADRTREKLGASDLAVVEFRRIMIEAARAMAHGGPAIGTHAAAYPACRRSDRSKAWCRNRRIGARSMRPISRRASKGRVPEDRVA